MTIRQALMQRIQAAGFTQPISWPGVNFTRPANGTWLEVRLFENTPDQPGISNDASVMMRGILQISACAKSGDGFMVIDQLAQQIIDAFPKGTPIVNQIRVRYTPYRMAGVTAPDYLLIPVSIPYGA